MARRGSRSSIGFPKSSELDSSHQQRYNASEVATTVARDGFNVAGYMDRNKIMNQLHEEHIQRRMEDRLKHEPGYAAMMHGHAPSKGARIDASIALEEAEFLAKKKKDAENLARKKMQRLGAHSGR
ncbi:hypothetical protein B0T10DRAFT_560202 [Thelonectria olida]|uniref:Uncharacterized protein n=1 Tax=Thelonectria olida TaxID=1576542 RepID=A0A9P8W8Q1_9HYPO|nr:hypothetical protein B0T10DRAFT_560202 [Thelonectria olida]